MKAHDDWITAVLKLPNSNIVTTSHNKTIKFVVFNVNKLINPYININFLN